MNEPVTVVVTRRVKAGRQAEYEAWLTQLLRDVTALPGYLGTTVHRPPPGGPREYTSVFRFDSIASLRAFESSDLRRHALQAVSSLVEADAAWRQLSGLEFWFSPPAGTVVPQPSRARMAIVMVVVVYALVLSIGQLVGVALAGAPSAMRLLVTIVIEVALMTWVIMPRLTRVLARWIYR
ncbi:antibiotic biosynthesis monooxygenase [Gemmatimonas groenlandica]|uniref:Antibiotic biosynthesis monooxygenase n=1 Tax=Gemmatimonas groenlandica TaxID=2732249 RepID=A0A6M4IS36_9BACT|nr:antibiotic biosynthesis monooxygenase [Gemmatimonas groenlandica]QJR36848.1 antibiotic biosynthesis monooxygenase [Gemmatimonas groenlandica]